MVGVIALGGLGGERGGVVRSESSLSGDGEFLLTSGVSGAKEINMSPPTRLSRLFGDSDVSKKNFSLGVMGTLALRSSMREWNDMRTLASLR